MRGHGVAGRRMLTGTVLALMAGLLAAGLYLAVTATNSHAQALGEYGVTEACASSFSPRTKIPSKVSAGKVCPVNAAEQAAKRRMRERAVKVAKKMVDSFESAPPLARDAGRLAVTAFDTYVTVVDTKDPADPHFKRRVHAHIAHYRHANFHGHRALNQAINRLRANTARVQAYWAAGFLAMERGLGAYKARNIRWRRIQGADAAHFYTLAARYAPGAIPATRAEVRAFRAAHIHIRKNGVVFPDYLASRDGLGIYRDVRSIMSYAAYLGRAMRDGYVVDSSSSGSPGGLGFGI